ncbi:HAD-IIIA family hydrolase [Halioxenophilus sp. WMMB6]|uniref:HAD-IIIA family hydrolase n=1 Tax=Halioxenophilus sp. WMMB6 TaxID=3073815 RepID=UPI00295E301B|nr:HAD-IIIA family hydrolase [Halioxenophilus sp. WMMB6]
MRLVVLNREGVLQPYQTGVQAGAQAEPAANYAATADALARLSQAGFTLVVASNEPGIGQGLLDLDDLEQSHARLNDQVENRGGSLAAFFYCPHAPGQSCNCRKPKTGLIDAIELEFAYPADQMLLVTDNGDDIELARQVGATALLVTTGLGTATLTELAEAERPANFTNLTAAADHILRHY